MVGGREWWRAYAQRLQIRLPDFGARNRIEPLQGGAVLNRLPGRRGQLATAFKADVFAVRRFPNHRMFRSAGILLAEAEAGGEFVNAGAHDDLAGLGLPGALHRLPRALEAAKRASSGSGIGIAAIGRDIESAVSACRQTGQRKRQAAGKEATSVTHAGENSNPPPASAQGIGPFQNAETKASSSPPSSLSPISPLPRLKVWPSQQQTSSAWASELLCFSPAPSSVS